MARTAALIVAAGRGHRAGSGLPKQYRLLAGKAVLRHTLERFAGHPAIDAVRCVMHPDDRQLYEEAAEGLELLAPVEGGATRQESVLNGLKSLSEGAFESVLIHDAARPFIDADVIQRVLDGLESHDGAIAAVPVVDTLKRGDGGLCGATVDRDELWRAQTPQGFRFRAILAAHETLSGRALTDDAAVAEAAGLSVALIEGSEDNVKLTTETDFRRAERALRAAAETRMGSGFDVHRFGQGDHVMLCGVRIAHDRGLEGHSDADVGLHALVDALLGALGEGDIGTVFPPSDAQWKNADSARFVEHARARLERRGARLRNADVTLICEAPKIGPHREAMRARIAQLLETAETRINVKATTTEKLGFTGRGEGVACQAVVSLAMPADEQEDKA